MSEDEPNPKDPDYKGGGWYQHNAERKAKGLAAETLDKDSPDHIQILTNYAKQHAAKFVDAFVRQRAAHSPHEMRAGLDFRMKCLSDRCSGATCSVAFVVCRTAVTCVLTCFAVP